MKSNNKCNGSNEYQKAIDFLEKGCDCGWLFFKNPQGTICRIKRIFSSTFQV